MPQYRLAFLFGITAFYLWFGLFRKKYTKRHEWLDNLSLMRNRANGIEYFSQINRNKEERITSLELSIEDIYGYDFSFKFEGRFERFFKSFGLSSECQSGDKKFDESIYIISDDEVLCRKLQKHSQLRDALYKLFWLHYDKGIKIRNVECFDGRLIVVAQNKNEDLSEKEAESFFTTSLPLMQGVLEHFPSKDQAQDPLYREESSKVAFVLRVIMVALLFNGLGMLFMELLHVKPLPQLLDSMSIVLLSLKISFVGVAFFGVLTYLYLRKSSRFSPVVLEIFTLGTLSIFLSALVEVREVNILLDGSQARYYQVEVIAKEIHKGRRSATRYYAILSGWRGLPQQKRTIDSSLYHRISQGRTIVVEEHPGYLGYVWIDLKTLSH